MVPTIIIDNFFPNPDAIREYALSIEDWHIDPDSVWPGIRTNNLHTFAQDEHDGLAWSVYNCLSNYITARYDSFSKFYCMFHIVGEEHHHGVIHSDGTDLDFAGLVYLSPIAPIDSGTSIYNNDLEVTTTQNVYNRCIIYDAHVQHTANKYFGKTMEDSRLALVFFGKLGNGKTNS
jgi:hypothetical protein